MANCNICNKPIVLTPSATERARKFGGCPADYSAMFTTHASCAIAKREADTIRSMRSITAAKSAQKVRFVSSVKT